MTRCLASWKASRTSIVIGAKANRRKNRCTSIKECRDDQNSDCIVIRERGVCGGECFDVFDCGLRCRGGRLGSGGGIALFFSRIGGAVGGSGSGGGGDAGECECRLRAERARAAQTGAD